MGTRGKGDEESRWACKVKLLELIQEASAESESLSPGSAQCPEPFSCWYLPLIKHRVTTENKMAPQEFHGLPMLPELTPVASPGQVQPVPCPGNKVQVPPNAWGAAAPAVGQTLQIPPTRSKLARLLQLPSEESTLKAPAFPRPWGVSSRAPSLIPSLWT